jgi:hypothetical protein
MRLVEAGGSSIMKDGRRNRYELDLDQQLSVKSVDDLIHI